jgi:hypothetical protein
VNFIDLQSYILAIFQRQAVKKPADMALSLRTRLPHQTLCETHVEPVEKSITSLAFGPTDRGGDENGR